MTFAPFVEGYESTVDKRIAFPILQKADAARKAEFEKWMPVTVSTDHDKAVSFFETEAGKMFTELQKSERP